MADFDFSNLIYLALIILFSVLGNRKRKKPREIIQNEGNKNSGNELDFLNKWLGVNNNQEDLIPEAVYSQNDVQEEKSTAPVWEEQKVDFREAEKTPNSFDSEGVSEFDESEKDFDIKSPLDQEIEKRFGLDDFDLRKAVIYSEILNRKTF